jgi:Putative transposase DNA-binding domain
VKAKLALYERTYACAACGLVLDRDVNAARNLAALGRRELAGSGPDSNGRGADRQTSPWGAGGCEASTRHAETRSGRDRPDARRDCGLSAFSAQLLRQLIPGTPATASVPQNPRRASEGVVKLVADHEPPATI